MKYGAEFVVGFIVGSHIAIIIAFLFVPNIPWVVERSARATMKEAYDRGYADAVITDDEKVQFKWKEARK